MSLKRVQLLFSLCILVLPGLVGCRETEYRQIDLEESIMSMKLIYIIPAKNGSARKSAKEMILKLYFWVDAIRNEAGNIRYDYFSLGDERKLCY